MKLADIRTRISHLEAELVALRADAYRIESEEADAHMDPEKPRANFGPRDDAPPASMGWGTLEYEALETEAIDAGMPFWRWRTLRDAACATPGTRDQEKLRLLAGWVGAWVQGGRP